MASDLGLDFTRDASGDRARFEVHSVRPARRVTADGEPRVDIVAVVTQLLMLPLDKGNPDGQKFPFRGGCTLILDREYGTDPIRYAVTRPIWNEVRQERERTYHQETSGGLNALYGGAAIDDTREPFALFHRSLHRDTGPTSGRMERT
jgi:hypothetical protein